MKGITTSDDHADNSLKWTKAGADLILKDHESPVLIAAFVLAQIRRFA